MIAKVYDDKFVVIRLPCLMEDEGNCHILAICDTRTEVAEFCKEYTESNQGYFRMFDLCYIGSYFSGGGPCHADMKEYLPMNIRERMEQRMQIISDAFTEAWNQESHLI